MVPKPLSVESVVAEGQASRYDGFELRRELVAVVVVDVYESVRHTHRRPDAYVRHWRTLVAAIRGDVLSKHQGRLVKSMGDGLLLTFPSARQAAGAALAVSDVAAKCNVGISNDEAVFLRIGVSVADVVIDDLDIYGEGVNLAARLAAIGEPGDIVVSDVVQTALVNGVGLELVDMGACVLKHFPAPVRAFRLLVVGGASIGNRASATDVRPGIAVMPFLSIGGSAESRALSIAIADGIIAALSRRSELRVIASLSTQALARAQRTGRESVAAHLGVAYLVSGHLQFNRDIAVVRITLSNARQGEVYWAESLRLGVAELFLGTDSLIPKVVAEIGATILRTELRRARTLPITSLAGYSLFIAATAMLHRLRKIDFNESRKLLERLNELEPRSPAPHALLAKWHLLNGVQGWSSDARASATDAEHHIRRAIERDPEYALALALRAHIEATRDHDLDKALATAAEALSANPQEPSAWMFMAGALDYSGRGAEAVEHARTAISLSPLDPSRFLFDLYLAAALTTAGRYAEAVEAAQASIRANALHPSSRRIAAIALALGGQVDEARKAGQQLMRLDPGFSISSFRERMPYSGALRFEREVEGLAIAGLPK